MHLVFENIAPSADAFILKNLEDAGVITGKNSQEAAIPVVSPELTAVFKLPEKTEKKSGKSSEFHANQLHLTFSVIDAIREAGIQGSKRRNPVETAPVKTVAEISPQAQKNSMGYQLAMCM